MTHEIKFLLPTSTKWTSITPKIDRENDSAEEIDKKEKEAAENKNKLTQALRSSMQMQNVMVLAGSGTSLGNTGGPSMKDLWSKCTKQDEEYSTPATEVAGLVKYDITDKSPENIEELLSLCNAYLQLRNKKKISDFVKDSKETILEACRFEKKLEQLNGHRTFIHRLSRRRARDFRLKLFTTNYDTCFEEAASNLGIVVIDGFSFTKPRRYDARFFDFDIVRRGRVSEISDNYLEGVFQLYKLHGSVNWERTGDVITETEATPDGVCMIFPAKGKYQQSYIQPHLELMARYLGALREPNTCLVVCGFGFNDDHLSEPIVSAIQSNPYLKVIIVDFEADSKVGNGNYPYWKKLKTLHETDNDVLFIKASFEEFAELIPDLKSLTPAEKMAGAVRSIAGDLQ